ncbi:MAG: 50S ribosomal protein L25/general stress protein Ctc [Alphaproteobacteria bacterium CG1_02_46_17]|nr:MAG: 50S ribosomal protein L25/general stress protein Ctc [Alphaproteobacteria bacterium CG1_02_46_17]
MSKHYTLTAQKRERAGKGVARALRRESRIPAVVYGDSKTPILISCLEKDITLQFLKGGMKTHMCDMDVEGEKVSVLARDIQLNPVTDRVEHIDFMRVGPKTKMTVSVPLHFINQEVSPGIKAKGILNIVHHHLDIRCAAKDIPEGIEIDMSEAVLGHAFKLKDIVLAKGTEVMGNDDPELTLANIIEPKVKAEPVEGAAEAAPAAATAAAAPAAEKK